jgi:hypothetical protein
MYVSDYRKLDEQTRKKIYNAYYNIIMNSPVSTNLTQGLTGILFENENKVFVLKIFNPVNPNDKRLLYQPVQIMRIGIDRKTSIPFKITDYSNQIPFNVIDENVYSDELFDMDKISDVVVDSMVYNPI